MSLSRPESALKSRFRGTPFRRPRPQGWRSRNAPPRTSRSGPNLEAYLLLVRLIEGLPWRFENRLAGTVHSCRRTLNQIAVVEEHVPVRLSPIPVKAILPRKVGPLYAGMQRRGEYLRVSLVRLVHPADGWGTHSHWYDLISSSKATRVVSLPEIPTGVASVELLRRSRVAPHGALVRVLSGCRAPIRRCGFERTTDSDG